jgi:hypothetical protein
MCVFVSRCCRMRMHKFFKYNKLNGGGKFCSVFLTKLFVDLNSAQSSKIMCTISLRQSPILVSAKLKFQFACIRPVVLARCRSGMNCHADADMSHDSCDCCCRGVRVDFVKCLFLTRASELIDDRRTKLVTKTSANLYPKRTDSTLFNPTLQSPFVIVELINLLSYG